MFINIGFGNLVMSDKIISIVKPDSAPIKRMIQEAKESNRLVDATFGRKTRAVIVCMDDKIVLAPVQPETILNRTITSTKESLNEEG